MDIRHEKCVSIYLYVQTMLLDVILHFIWMRRADTARQRTGGRCMMGICRLRSV